MPNGTVSGGLRTYRKAGQEWLPGVAQVTPDCMAREWLSEKVTVETGHQGVICVKGDLE